MAWGTSRIDRKNKHTPSQGQFSRVFIALLLKGERTLPIEQDFIAGGFSGLATVVAVTSGNSYVALVAGTAYTVVAGLRDTKKTIAKKLMGLINASPANRAINLRLSGSNYLFNVIGEVSFTLANTGTTTLTDLTVGTVAGSNTAIAAGATTIALPIPVRGNIAAGQWLGFIQPDGFERIAKVVITAVDSATSLNVAPLDEPIAAGSTCIYPVEFGDRKDASMNESYSWAGFSTFNTEGHEDAVGTGSTGEGNFGGIYYEYDPGYRTVVDGNVQDFREFQAIVQYGNPKEGYTKPTISGIVGFSGVEQPLAVDGLIDANFPFKTLTPLVRELSVPDV